jgi:hypothetical protein
MPVERPRHAPPDLVEGNLGLGFEIHLAPSIVGRF